MKLQALAGGLHTGKIIGAAHVDRLNAGDISIGRAVRLCLPTGRAANRWTAAMEELLREEDLGASNFGLYGFAEALLNEAGIEFVIVTTRPFVGAEFRTMLVAKSYSTRARKILIDAGLGDKLVKPPPPGPFP